MDGKYAAMFLFLAATMVAVFTFVSIAQWVTARARERETHDRYALLKSLAEQPTDTARQILDLMREGDRRHERNVRSDRLLGGIITFGIGVGLAIMLAVLAREDPGVWTVGLIPMLIGAVLFVFTLLTKPEKSE